MNLDEIRIDNTEYDKEKKRVEELKRSPLLKDRILGILMDDDIGALGFWEKYATLKTQAIWEQIEKEKQNETSKN